MEGGLLVQKRLEEDVVAFGATSSPPELWLQSKGATGLACSAQLGQCNDDENFYSK